MNLSNFGSKLKLDQNNSFSEKDTFIQTITTMDACWIRTNHLHENVGVDFYNYEEPFFNMIEDLIYLHYGEELGEVILWYVYDRFDADDKLLGVEVTFPGKPPKVFKLKTPLDLWNLITKIKKSQNDE